MEEEALLRIEAELHQVALALGQPQALRNDLYRRRTSVDSEETAVPVRDRTIEKMRVVVRLLSLHDKATYEAAMRNIQLAVEQAPPALRSLDLEVAYIPAGAVVIDKAGDESGGYTFADLPDLSEEKRALLSLALELEGGDGYLK